MRRRNYVRACSKSVLGGKLTRNTRVIHFDYSLEPSMDEKNIHLDKLKVNRASETEE